MLKKKQGFTLIELLVVIAIIGILSSVVLASLNTARDKGADSAVKANLSGIRAQAELEYDRGACSGDGAGTCLAGGVADIACAATGDTIFAEPTVWSAITAAKAAGSGLAACSSSANQAAYAIVVQLKSDATKAWCIDNTGKSKEVSVVDATQANLNLEVTGGACVD